ncbi:MAG: hypothetical protein ACTHLE_14320 [Agriterribacter sp.]
MWWKRKKEVDEAQWTDGAALRILKGYRSLQHRWVRLMETLVQGWSVRKQKLLLLVVAVPAAMYCLTLVYDAVKGKGVTVNVEKIKTGEHIGLPKIDSTKINK